MGKTTLVQQVTEIARLAVRFASADEAEPLDPLGAAASALGVILASVLAYSFSVLLKPLAQEFAWSREELGDTA